jgi:hypothetical protein
MDIIFPRFRQKSTHSLRECSPKSLMEDLKHFPGGHARVMIFWCNPRIPDSRDVIHRKYPLVKAAATMRGPP